VVTRFFVFLWASTVLYSPSPNCNDTDIRLREESDDVVTLDSRQERQQGQNKIVSKGTQHQRISFDSPSIQT